MPYFIANFCHLSDNNNPGNAHFHRLPKSGCLRRICYRSVGDRVDMTRYLVARVCSLHFSKEDYDNIRQFEAGFASCLVLKAGAVPRLFGEPGVPVEKVAANFQ